MRTLLECYKILEDYPNGMTKDQFYRVARINKQHAKYLLDSGLVPCINTGIGLSSQEEVSSCQ